MQCRTLFKYLRSALAFGVLLAGSAFAEMVYNRGNTVEPESLDPHKTSTVGEAHILRDLFEGLVMPDARGDLIPGAAESWTVSDDGTVYTFKLRDDAVWSNGDPVTADDFVYSFGRLEDPETGRRIRLDALRHQECRGDQFGQGEARRDRRARRRSEDARNHAQRADAVLPGDADASGGLSGASGHRGEIRRGMDEARQSRLERRLHARRMGAERSRHDRQESEIP